MSHKQTNAPEPQETQLVSAIRMSKFENQKKQFIRKSSRLCHNSQRDYTKLKKSLKQLRLRDFM